MDDSIYAGLLEPTAQASAVGVVLEPTHNFNEGVFRVGTKYILVAIMWQLQRKDVGYKPLAKLLTPVALAVCQRPAVMQSLVLRERTALY